MNIKLFFFFNLNVAVDVVFFVILFDSCFSFILSVYGRVFPGQIVLSNISPYVAIIMHRAVKYI